MKFRNVILVILMSVFLSPLTALANTSAKTKNPIVFVHGIFGFDSIVGNYFYGFNTVLASNGQTDVYAPNLSSTNSNEELGKQLIQYLDGIVSDRGVPTKFNVIAHSQGGLASRYALAKRPELFVSLTTIGTPHFGTPVADFIDDSGLDNPFVISLSNGMANLMSLMAGKEVSANDSLGGMTSMTSAGANLFNNTYPAGIRKGSCKNPLVYEGWWWWQSDVYDYAVNDGDHTFQGVQLYSWGSTYSATNLLHRYLTDPADVVLNLGKTVMDEPSDGVVGICSTHFGLVVDQYIGDHADQINGMWGQRGWETTDFLAETVDHIRFLNALE